MQRTSGLTNNATVKPNEQGVLLADAVANVELLDPETFSIKMAELCAWTGEDMNTDAFILRSKSFYRMLIEQKYTRAEFIKQFDVFLSRAYPRWMPKDFFYQTERVKLYDYAWVLKRVQSGDTSEVERWLLPNGTVAFKPMDGVDVQGAERITDQHPRNKQ